jgi:hypothetical protein
MTKNKTNLILGIGLILFSLAIFTSALSSLVTQSRNQSIISSEDSKVSQDADVQKGVSLTSLVKVAEAAYDKNDIRKKEGFLWVDRKSSKFVVTLGAINGLIPGSQLTVYNGEKSIGQVQVAETFDVISYVLPLNESIDLSQGDYYKVAIK